MLAIRQVDYPEKKVFLWNNSIPDVNVDMIEYPNGLADDEQYIVTIARPSYQKNTLMMVEIMNKVHKVLPRLKFYLLGAGDNVYAPLQNEMKELIRKYDLESVCKMLPWLPHKDALGYLKYAQLYLTTSLYEGLPIAVLEAMSLGKAIVASDVVGNRDCVQDGLNGMLMPMESESFADTICELLKDEDRRALMGKNARKLFETEFMVEQRIQQLESIYTKIYHA
jgi:glycosyltransferase involved in cell wall biosynthesis